MEELCSQCHEKPAKGSLPWYMEVPLMLFGGGGGGGKLCDDCAGSSGVIALFWLVAVVVAVFIVAVIICRRRVFPVISYTFSALQLGLSFHAACNLTTRSSGPLRVGCGRLLLIAAAAA